MKTHSFQITQIVAQRQLDSARMQWSRLPSIICSPQVTFVSSLEPTNHNEIRRVMRRHGPRTPSDDSTSG
ncbi:hypothetical protein DAEQUDRAFT_722018 [Daedalea quercina L-15889]|uniref:Uncharacterized protein n=1 Tax=Daedalea quercina L-15889 TaxID=1314783 RepID=A0A165TGJ8_9APHY|nr:hypothetical protein DAEQUDRAFT_722018 [Daedalea quercina L-15889]